MVRVEKRIKVHREGKVFEVTALFDTGSRRSYFSRNFAEKWGLSLIGSLGKWL